ncbi:MAG: phosphoribosyltransferase family protein [Lachnospiraceae bacterium]|nr:phosphoribosyltransferase family protein [Lachnospiraceae bacterium]
MYTEKDLVLIAKRENNMKRQYLVVNMLQGKHIPVSPKEAFSMFSELADIVKDRYERETLLLIGFAETATAIGAALAAELNTYYMQTTRENIRDVEYLFFSESHSHATEQKLVKTDLDTVINRIDRIIFVEDEVTTGNTILNIINIIEKEYSGKIKFSVASLLNGMDEKSEKVYDERNIDTLYLVKTNHGKYTEIAQRFKGDGVYHTCNIKNENIPFQEETVSNYVNARRLNLGGDYYKCCEKMWEEISGKTDIGENKNVLVIGTEEFMYPALFVAKKIEENNNFVRCHSTTRSPIEVSSEEEYPLHQRYELKSLYDNDRKTFIYDIGRYDMVIIITDSYSDAEAGVNSLINAVYGCGNEKICLIKCKA